MKKTPSLIFFLGSLAANIWLSNVYRKTLYLSGQNNFIADAGANLLVVSTMCSLFWLVGKRITKSYTFDILIFLSFYELIELASFYLPILGTFDWKDLIAYAMGALVVWAYFLVFRIPNAKVE